jgi:GAF domain-containing protein
VNPGTLARGLLAQILPESLCDGLAGGQLLLLLRAAILLQNIDRGPSILGGIMEMLNQTLDCEASSILLADPAEREMLIVLPTGWMKKTVLGRGMALDKGLAGWVYRNGQPAMVNNAAADQRFHGGLDRDTGFVTRSVLAVPLFVRGECIGALEALNTRHDNFSDSDRNLLFLFANLMGNAMVAVCGD